MINNIEIKKTAIAALNLEGKAILNLTQFIDDNFVNVIDSLINLSGRIIVTGIGKSAIIAQKIVATLNSTGTPAIFMHAADAIHGDLGIIQQNDQIMVLSKSGNTPEIKVLVPYLKQTGNTLIGMVGNLDSFLAQQADFIINTTVTREACPNNLAPTSSTTAQLAMGDAIAICLQHYRQFSDRDFARYHPGGALGKQLYLKVSDLSKLHGRPQVSPQSSIQEVLISITSNRLGATAVMQHGQTVGIITDGDIRRMLEKHRHIESLKAIDVMSNSPKTIAHDELAANALHLMRQNNIAQLLVFQDGNYVGIIHIQDLLKEGIL